MDYPKVDRPTEPGWFWFKGATRPAVWTILRVFRAFSAYKTNSIWGGLALVFGVVAMVLAVAEVMARADEKVTSDVERFKQNMELIRAVAAGLKPNPPGVEFIREGGEPVERS